MEEYNAQALDDFNKKSLLACKNCGRTFLPRPLEIHSRSCKPGQEKWVLHVMLLHHSYKKHTNSINHTTRRAMLHSYIYFNVLCNFTIICAMYMIISLSYTIPVTKYLQVTILFMAWLFIYSLFKRYFPRFPHIVIKNYCLDQTYLIIYTTVRQ